MLDTSVNKELRAITFKFLNIPIECMQEEFKNEKTAMTVDRHISGEVYRNNAKLVIFDVTELPVIGSNVAVIVLRFIKERMNFIERIMQSSEKMTAVVLCSDEEMKSYFDSATLCYELRSLNSFTYSHFCTETVESFTLSPEYKPLFCAQCGTELTEGNYLMIGDNYLQANFIEAENNHFCSKSCLCRYLSVSEVMNFNEDNAFSL